jgi:hypothetical protein
VCDGCFNTLLATVQAPSEEKAKTKLLRRVSVELIRDLRKVVNAFNEVLKGAPMDEEDEDFNSQGGGRAISTTTPSKQPHVDDVSPEEWDSSDLDKSAVCVAQVERNLVKFSELSVEYRRMVAKLQQDQSR